VEISGERDVRSRKAIVERVLLFEKDDDRFHEKWDREDRELRSIVRDARDRLSRIRLPEHIVNTVAEVNNTLDISGHRGDLAILKTARALAALRGGEELAAPDLRDAIRLALPHRVPRSGVSAARAYHVERLLSWAFPGETVEEEDRGPVVPLPDTMHGLKRGGVIFRALSMTPQEQERQAIARAAAARHRYEAAEAAAENGPGTCGDPDCDVCQGYVQDTVIDPSEPYQIRKIVAPKGRKLSDASGKRSKSRTKGARGRYVRSVRWEKGRDIALDATLFAAAVGGHVERATGRVRITTDDLRGKHRERKVGNLILIVLDASASMETQQRMVATKGAILSLLRDAYVKRDRVGLISFRDTMGEVVVPPTGSASLAAMRLTWLASGGTTPLSIGLFAAVKTLETEQARDPSRKPILAVITDGRANVAYFGGEPLEEAVKIAKTIRKMRVTSLVIDADRMVAGPAALRSAMEATQKSARTRGIFSDGPARTVSDAMGAKYYSLAEMSRSAILKAIRSRMTL
jgi:magnesium chelatase subunit D